MSIGLEGTTTRSLDVQSIATGAQRVSATHRAAMPEQKRFNEASVCEQG
eukprot:jgi/Mesvir1/6429/Mv25840-RA.1